MGPVAGRRPARFDAMHAGMLVQSRPGRQSALPRCVAELCEGLIPEAAEWRSHPHHDEYPQSCEWMHRNSEIEGHLDTGGWKVKDLVVPAIR